MYRDTEKILSESLCGNEKISHRAVFPVQHRGNIVGIQLNYFRNSFLGRVGHVRSKETARLEAVDGGAGRFLRRHPTRVSCVFIRGVGSPWNENGAPGGVRRELVFPAHFSRKRPPENRLSPRGPTTVSRAQYYTFPILASHPFQSSPDVKGELPDGRRRSSRLRKRRRDIQREAERRGSLREEDEEDANGKEGVGDAKKSAISAIRTSVIAMNVCCRARKSEKISVLAPVGNSGPCGKKMEAGKL